MVQLTILLWPHRDACELIVFFLFLFWNMKSKKTKKKQNKKLFANKTEPNTKNAIILTLFLCNMYAKK